MIRNPPKNVPAWVSYFDHQQLPVLRRTVDELARLREKEDDLNGRDLSEIILHDPLMTIKVLRYLQTHRSRGQTTEITTIHHAIMMVGTTPFFSHFVNQPTIENALAAHPSAFEGMMRVMSRARHAALYSRDWSELRHDIESDEVTIAALLRDMAEMLLWAFAPELILEMEAMKRDHPGLRSAAAQQAVLGFRGVDLQLALAAEWHLPKLLQTLMDDDRTATPRARVARTAVALARHSAKGWFDPALPDDYEAISKTLGLSPQETWERVRKVALKAAREWDWYGVPPAAAWLPMLPEDAQ